MIYEKRTIEPSKDNKNYIQVTKGGYNKCILITGNSCLPNCVGYSWGRWREFLGYDPNLSRGNAQNWYNYCDGYKRGSTPKLGAVVCYKASENSKTGYGHVCIVEEIYNDGSILVSSSDYGGRRFYTKKLEKNYYYASTLSFQGFIYPPVEFEDGKVKYLNISPEADFRSVYSDIKITKKIGEIKPKKYGGLSYKIYGKYENEVVKIKTTTYGYCYISSKSIYYSSVDNIRKYKNGD